MTTQTITLEPGQRLTLEPASAARPLFVQIDAGPIFAANGDPDANGCIAFGPWQASHVLTVIDGSVISQEYANNRAFQPIPGSGH
jgi:hypothetical protein